MAEERRVPDSTLLILGVLLGLGIFAVDLSLPLGLAVPMAYIALVLVTLWTDRQIVTLTLTGLGILLTLGGYWLSPEPPGGHAIINRILVLSILAVTAGLVMLHRSARQEIRTLHQFLSLCASCRRIKDHDGRWQNLERYVETTTPVQFTHGLCPLCIEKWYPEIYPELVLRHPHLDSQPGS